MCLCHGSQQQKNYINGLYVFVYLPRVYPHVLAEHLRKSCCLYRPASVVRIYNTKGKMATDTLFNIGQSAAKKQSTFLAIFMDNNYI